MTISRFSASRRNRERSSLISDKGTSFIRDFRIAPAILQPPIWGLWPRSQWSRLIRSRIIDRRQHGAGIAASPNPAFVSSGFGFFSSVSYQDASQEHPLL